MSNSLARAFLFALAVAISGALPAQTTLPQDTQATQPNTSAPDTPKQSSAPAKREPDAPMSSTQQDHVTASHANPDPDAKTTGMNRAVTAPGKTPTAHPAVHAKASPAPTAEKPASAPDRRAPVESHSAIQQNPKLPTSMPPPQGAPSAPPPNRDAAQPNDH